MEQKVSDMLRVRVGFTAAIADGIHLFELHDPEGAELPAFTAGAHLIVQLPTGQKRSYSLCNDPAERNKYVIAVKREEAGRGGSKTLIDMVHAGDDVLVSHPQNNFALKGNPSKYIFIAGGIGITPIRSMIKHVLGTTARPFKLYYFTRSRETTAFHDEFADPAYQGKVVLHHDGGDPSKAYDLWPVLETPTPAHIYCCGPRPLMNAVKDMSGHWPASSVHFEDFGSDLVTPRADDIPFKVTLAKSGKCFEVDANASILDVLRRNGVTVPSSCESGTCGTCRTRHLGGEPDHRDLVLTEDEKARDMMICVSRARSSELVLDL